MQQKHNVNLTICSITENRSIIHNVCIHHIVNMTLKDISIQTK